MIEREKLISLVQAVQQGDGEAAGVLYDTFQKDIYFHILKNVNNDAELAADLTQDTFMEILETIGKLEEPAAFVTWSQRIAYHKCTAYFRKRRELLVDEDADGYSVFDTLEEDREEFIPGEALDREDLKRAVRDMIDALPADQRSAVLLRYFNEISVKEIAQVQGVSEGTVKSRLNYARKAIKDAVERYEKKNGIKLHCVGVVPLLLWVFREYRLQKSLPLTYQTAAATFPAAETTAGATVGAGLFAAGKVTAAKVIAGIAAAAVVIGGATLAVPSLRQPESTEPPVSQTEAIEQTTAPTELTQDRETIPPTTEARLEPATEASQPETQATQPPTEATRATEAPTQPPEEEIEATESPTDGMHPEAEDGPEATDPPVNDRDSVDVTPDGSVSNEDR